MTEFTGKAVVVATESILQRVDSNTLTTSQSFEDNDDDIPPLVYCEHENEQNVYYVFIAVGHSAQEADFFFDVVKANFTSYD